MSRAQLIEMARRNLAHQRAGTVDQSDDVYRVPVANYFDPDRFERELDRVFRRLPLVLGFSAELRDAGAYKAVEVAGVPVLLTRAEDGLVRAFVNQCSHRGAIVVADGLGSARRFQCPYHGWTYDSRGALLGISNQKSFGEVDKSCLGLVELPAAERAGLVFAGIRPGASLDFDRFLCGYDEVLGCHGFEKCHVVGQQSVEGPNWKIAYDGYLDFYHLPFLHKDSFGANMPNQALYDAWGPHQRVTAPNPALRALAERPEDEWDQNALSGGVWTIFPHVSIADFDAGGRLYMVSQLFPGETPDRSTTVQTFLSPREPDDRAREAIAGTMAFLLHVVRDEDYYTGKRIQRALRTGALEEVLFGRNEGGGQRFHRFVDALLEADDEELPALFERGVDPR